ncbi:hypothetical protein TrST_g7436 [Triparma strigata]|uniref:Uncharacterized protein n=1 Tax=Triparma strigata TaxID=1606541 RepID=A0A9W6ZJ67_9STRA|nr:hypothetical protein TrST_g7436 [Triparma strigata]
MPITSRQKQNHSGKKNIAAADPRPHSTTASRGTSHNHTLARARGDNNFHPLPQSSPAPLLESSSSSESDDDDVFVRTQPPPTSSSSSPAQSITSQPFLRVLTASCHSPYGPHLSSLETFLRNLRRLGIKPSFLHGWTSITVSTYTSTKILHVPPSFLKLGPLTFSRWDLAHTRLRDHTISMSFSEENRLSLFLSSIIEADEKLTPLVLSGWCCEARKKRGFSTIYYFIYMNSVEYREFNTVKTCLKYLRSL